jgi:SAM-dependent methyltransferase
MHPGAYKFVQNATEGIGIDIVNARILELGSYIVNGTVRNIYNGCENYVGVDLRPGEGVDVVADATRYCPKADEGRYDLVVTTEMLEHCKEPEAVIRNVYKLLKPGGYFIMTAAGPERAPHGNDGMDVGEEYYGNIEPTKLKGWLKIFENEHIECRPDLGDVYAVAKKKP